MDPEPEEPDSGTAHRRHCWRAHGYQPRIATLLAVVLVVAGCSSGTSAPGTHAATVTINGTELDDRTRVRCQQVEWIWLIKTVLEAPGFTGVTVGSAKATVDDGTFKISPAADGFYGESVSDQATADFEKRTGC